jgi:hypothetical protein
VGELKRERERGEQQMDFKSICWQLLSQPDNIPVFPYNSPPTVFDFISLKVLQTEQNKHGTAKSQALIAVYWIDFQACAFGGS